MPAYNDVDNAMATKIVTLFPQNKEKCLSSIHATILLHDVKFGRLKAVCINIFKIIQNIIFSHLFKNCF